METQGSSVGDDKTDKPSILEKIIRASQLKQDYLTTSCSAIDEFLCGGIPTFGITEVTGESASGKTQLCLQLALTAQLPTSRGGFDGEVVYISTEKLFPIQRLAELSEYFIEIYGDLLPDTPMDKINLEHSSDTKSLLQCLEVRLPNLMAEKKGKVRLVIVDSIAALFRADYGKDEMEKRTEDLRRVGVTLHNLSRDYNAAIFVINQVTGSLTKSDQGGNANVPSLGLAWTNLVTTRIFLSRTSDGNRLLNIKFAPHIPVGSLPIQLGADGFRALTPTYKRN